jgi:hypothetical protein
MAAPRCLECTGKIGAVIIVPCSARMQAAAGLLCLGRFRWARAVSQVPQLWDGYSLSRTAGFRRSTTPKIAASARRSTWRVGQRVARKDSEERGTVTEQDGSIKVKWDGGRTSYFRHADEANVGGRARAVGHLSCPILPRIGRSLN